MAKEPLVLGAKARNEFADIIEQLSDEQLTQPTLCGDWTPHQILAHVVMLTELQMPRFMFNMAKAGFNYDKMADSVATKMASEHSVEELVARLRENADRPAPMPGFGEMIPVGDVSVHIQDIRRPFDLPGELDEDLLTMALEFITTHKIGIDLRDIPDRDAIRFEATDLDWSHGEGDVARGPGESILMTLAGRANGELTGDGAAKI